MSEQDVGTTIRELLHRKRWTQRDLADVLGYSGAYISDVLAGKRKVSPAFATRLAAAFEGTTAEYWFGFRTAADMADGSTRDTERALAAPLRTCPVHGKPWRDHARCGQ